MSALVGEILCYRNDLSYCYMDRLDITALADWE